LLASPEMVGPQWWAVPDTEGTADGDASCPVRAAWQGCRRRQLV